MMPERDVDPSVYRRRLRNILRRTREAQGITQATAAHAMEWSVSKLIRIETGAVTISVNDLKALLAHYEIADVETVNRLISMAKNSRKHSWLGGYRGIASEVFLTFLGHEDAAIRSYSFQPILIPGLLQTDDYASEVLQVTRGSKDSKRINGLIDLRLARQERVFARTDGIKLSYLLDESVIRRVVGGEGVMRAQLKHLIDEYERDNLSIRIIPFSSGLYRSIRVPFVVLEFTDPADDAVLYLEYPQGESLIREDGPFDDGGAGAAASPPTTAPTYLQIFAELQQRTSDNETMQILQSAFMALNTAE
jgi:transcriptional regulator with XRE-family HTH domain